MLVFSKSLIQRLAFGKDSRGQARDRFYRSLRSGYVGDWSNPKWGESDIWLHRVRRKLAERGAAIAPRALGLAKLAKLAKIVKLTLFFNI